MSLLNAFNGLIKLVKWVIIIAVLTTFAAITALYVVVSPSWIAERVNSFANENLRTGVTFEGEAALSHLPKIEIQFPAGTFTDSDTGNVIGRFSSASAKISPWGLLIGQLHISSLSLDGLKTAVEVPDEKKLTQITALPIASDGSWIKPVDIRRLTLTNAEIRVGGLRPSPVVFSGISFSSGAVSPHMTSPVSFSAEAESPADGLKASVTGEGIVDFDLPNHILGFPQLTLEAKGTLSGAPLTAAAQCANFQYLQGSFTAKSVQAKAVTSGGTPVSLEAELSDVTTQEDTVSGSVTRFSVTQSLGNGSQSVSAVSPFTFEKSAKTLTLSSLQTEYTLAADNAPAIDLSLSGNASADFASDKFSVATSGTLNSEPFTATLSGGFGERTSVRCTISADRVNLSPKESDEPNDFRWENIPRDIVVPLESLLGGTDAEGTLRIKTLLFPGAEAQDFRTEFALKEGSLQLSGLEAGIYGGSLTGSAGFTPDGDWTLSANASGIDCMSLSGGKDSGTLSGKLDSVLRLSGSGAGLPGFYKKISGSASFKLRDGVLPGITPSGLAFRELTGQASVADGIASVNDLQAEGALFSLSGKEEADLQTLAVAGEALIRNRRGGESQVIIDGTVFKPVWTLSSQIPFEEEKKTETVTEGEGKSLLSLLPASESPAASEKDPPKEAPKDDGFFSGAAERAKNWFKSLF